MGVALWARDAGAAGRAPEGAPLGDALRGAPISEKAGETQDFERARGSWPAPATPLARAPGGAYKSVPAPLVILFSARVPAPTRIGGLSPLAGPSQIGR